MALGMLSHHWRRLVYNLVSVHPKSMKLGQMTTLNVIFHVVVSVYQLVKI